jgi:hypothetical protein
MVTRHHDHRRLGQAFPQQHEGTKGVQDGGIGRPHGVEHVATDDDQIGGHIDDLRDGPLHSGRDVVLALVAARRGEPLVLAEAEMEIGEVDETHPQN